MPLWFRRKTYGYGWTPATKEGWWVIALYVLVVALTTAYFFSSVTTPLDVVIFVCLLALANGVLIYVCFRTGETPRWQWGEESSDTGKGQPLDIPAQKE